MTFERTRAGRVGDGQGLACPPEIAQWLHDEVVQRLASVAAAIGSDGTLANSDRARCGVELEAALGALRVLLHDRVERRHEGSFRTVAEAVRAECEAPGGCEVQLRVLGDAEVSSATGHFVADFVAEAIRNIAKHARARQVVLTVDADADAVRVVADNDGVPPVPAGATAPGDGGGLGLRLLAARALDHGGFVSTGAAEPDGWSTRLTLTQPPNGLGEAEPEERWGR